MRQLKLFWNSKVMPWFIVIPILTQVLVSQVSTDWTWVKGLGVVGFVAFNGLLVSRFVNHVEGKQP